MFTALNTAPPPVPLRVNYLPRVPINRFPTTACSSDFRFRGHGEGLSADPEVPQGLKIPRQSSTFPTPPNSTTSPTPPPPPNSTTSPPNSTTSPPPPNSTTSPPPNSTTSPTPPQLLLKRWGDRLNERDSKVKVSFQGKLFSATHSQTVDYIKPLFKNLTNYVSNPITQTL